jgi:hypothetical protein
MLVNPPGVVAPHQHNITPKPKGNSKDLKTVSIGRIK